MSQENVEIVRQQAEAFARGDWAKAMSFLDPDVVYDISRYSAAGTVVRGIEQLRAGYREWVGSWEGYRAEVLEVIDAGDDKVVVSTRQTGKAPLSDVPVEVANAVVMTLTNGKVVRQDVYPTLAGALEAVGLPE
jgi:ketosteroid isomerase-like protein